MDNKRFFVLFGNAYLLSKDVFLPLFLSFFLLLGTFKTVIVKSAFTNGHTFIM